MLCNCIATSLLQGAKVRYPRAEEGELTGLDMAMVLLSQAYSENGRFKGYQQFGLREEDAAKEEEKRQRDASRAAKGGQGEQVVVVP